MMFSRDEAREYLDAARSDHEVVVAAAERLAAIFDDAELATFGPVFGRNFLQPDDPMRDAVHRTVDRLGREIVEHQNCRARAGEIMLQREYLAPVAQGGLRQEAD